MRIGKCIANEILRIRSAAHFIIGTHSLPIFICVCVRVCVLFLSVCAFEIVMRLPVQLLDWVIRN